MYAGVTTILKAVELAPDYGTVPQDVLARAAARGSAVHRAVDLFERNDLDEESLHPEIRPYFNGYLKFREKSGWRWICGEMQLVSHRWGVVGHPDCIGWLGADRAIVDLKCIAAMDRDYLNYVNFQVRGGYGLLWDEEHPTEPLTKYFGLQLMPEDYRLHPLTRPDARQVFQAACIVYRAKIGARNGNEHSVAA